MKKCLASQRLEVEGGGNPSGEKGREYGGRTVGGGDDWEGGSEQDVKK